MLLNCAAYQHGIKTADVPIADISEHLKQPDTLVWVALKNATPDELAEMKSEFDLHELAVEDARNGHQRPKIEEYGDSLFVVAHVIEFHGEELTLGEIDIFVGSNFVLSVRSKSQHDFLGVRARCERQPQLLKQGAGFVLYALLDAVVDRYFPIADALESKLEAIEAKIFSKGNARENIEHLYDLKQQVMTLKHAVSPLMESVAKLSSGHPHPLCANTQAYFRDVYDHLVRINSTVDTIRDTIATAIQVNLAMVTIEQGEVGKRLAAWAGIFAVATAFAGIWGMNFKKMPELEWQYGYPAALSLITATCFVLYRRFKRAGWL